jgi:hypothetical protein
VLSAGKTREKKKKKGGRKRKRGRGEKGEKRRKLYSKEVSNLYSKSNHAHERFKAKP